MSTAPLAFRLPLLLFLAVLLTTLQPADAGTAKAPKWSKNRLATTQSIELGNVGEKARVDIKQVQGVDPKEHAKVLDMLAKRDADARKYEQRAVELEKELQKARESAVSRVLAQAAQQEADDLARRTHEVQLKGDALAQAGATGMLTTAQRSREALLKGDSALAEQLLRQQEDRAAATPEGKGREAAELAREIAALAIGRDSKAAVAALERAARYLPEDFRTRVQLGDAQVLLGQSAAAVTSYKTAHAIAESLAARDPANTAWQPDLLVSLDRIGDVLLAQGDWAGAADVYRQGRAIAESLAARDPANTAWQHDLAVSHEKSGDVLLAQGDGAGALAAYRKSLAVRESVAARDPVNTKGKHNLSVMHEKIGDVLLAQGDGAGALAAYRKGLAIAEVLAARDAANTGWQRDLAVSHGKIGNVLVAQGDWEGALAAYRKGHAIFESLAARDAANTGWQRDLSVSHNKIGNVLVAQGDWAGALAAYGKSLAIRESLAARDPANAQWQVDVAWSCSNIGSLEQLDTSERRAYLQRGVAILRTLRHEGRLLPNQDRVEWFESALRDLDDPRPQP